MINNQKYYAQEIQKEAKEISDRLGERSANPLAISNRDYEICELTQRLGYITEYNNLGIISDLLKIPVPFIEPPQFYRKINGEEKFQKITGSDKNRMIKQRNCFRDMYAQIAKNIITLVEHDINSMTH